jgi:hypothetical protein
MPTYKYYIQGQEFIPTNRGDYTHDYNLEEEAGFYQFVYSLSGAVAFGADVLSFINKHSDCQKLTFVINERTDAGEFTLFNGYFTNRDCEFSPDDKTIEITPRQDTAYECLKKNVDVKFNFLRLGDEVSVVYDPTPRYEFVVLPAASANIYLPFYGLAIENSSGNALINLFATFCRETITTYCRGGELQKPAGTGWELLVDECAVKNTATWWRTPPIFVAPTSLSSSDFGPTPYFPPAPPVPPASPKNWILMDTLVQGGSGFAFWADYDAIRESSQTITNGRGLVNVVNYGLNDVGCPEMDFQSDFLTDLLNPVTGNSPSSTEGIGMFAISDVKSPTADIKATRELVSLKDIFEGYLYGKLNCLLRVDNPSKRLICEHVSQFIGATTYDITTAQGLNRKYNFDNSDIPRSEEFPSLDESIDFTGVDIRYNNDCAQDIKAFTTDKFYSEVEFIFSNPDEYPNDGVVMITPQSLAPSDNPEGDGDRSEDGYITGDYRANAPQAMANLHNKFGKFWRPFPRGRMNLENTEFSLNKPVKVLKDTISVPLCNLGGSFYKFDPYAFFKGKDFNKGYLQSASYNESTKEVELNINYYE